MRPIYNSLRNIPRSLHHIPIRAKVIHPGPIGKIMGLKWTCTENDDGSLTLYNHAARRELQISSQCVKLGCACTSPSPDSIQDYWIHLCVDPHHCRTVKGPIHVHYVE